MFSNGQMLIHSQGEEDEDANVNDSDKSWREEIPEDDLESEQDLYVSQGIEVSEEDTEYGDEEDEEEDDEEEDDTAVPADALGVNDSGWKSDEPKSLPLTYYVPSDATGGLMAKTIKHHVDFDDHESVLKANKTRRLEVNRAKKRHGIPAPLKRPSTRGREYTDQNRQTIIDLHEDWAENNDGLRIPADELTVLYNRTYPGENRTKQSLSR